MLYHLFLCHYGKKFQWRERRVYIIDGTRVNLPRAFIHKKYKTPGKNAYYPQGIVSMLYDAIAQLPVNAVLSRHRNERAAAAQILPSLQAGDLLLYDRGYLSSDLLAQHAKLKIDVVFRVPRQTFKEFQRFWQTDEKESLIRLQRKNLDINLRLIRYRVKGSEIVLVTTLCDSAKFPARALAKLYGKRWRIEEAFKELKQSLTIEKWHSYSTNGVKQELYVGLIQMFLSRLFRLKGQNTGKAPSTRVCKTIIRKALLRSERWPIGMSMLRQGYILSRKYRIESKSNRSFTRISRLPIGKFRLPRKKRARMAKALCLLAEKANVP